MVHKHPKMVSRIKIGTTVEDNPLYVLKVKIIQELLILIILEKYELKLLCDTTTEFWDNKDFCIFLRTYKLQMSIQN